MIQTISKIRPARAGKSAPLGATVMPGGVNFSLYSRHATGVELLLFDSADAERPSRIIPFDPAANRTADYWHHFVAGLQPGQVYAYRVFGPDEPHRGYRFNPRKILIDPYGRGVAQPAAYDRRAIECDPAADSTAIAFRSVIVDPSAYDWEGDALLHRPCSETVIYETHVRGFTAHPNSGVRADRRGTYLGVIEKIPYLLDLGITAVELLPVMQFDPQDAPLKVANYWGYSTVSFFSPHLGFATANCAQTAANEFRDMVKALHRAGIEVILDVVFNHTAEGTIDGPTHGFRGIDNSVYYLLDEKKQKYLDLTGCGNTVNCNHAIVRRLILDSLTYWVREMHVDGFRFDLAAIFARDHSGQTIAAAPIIHDIEHCPELAGVKLVAEPWDAAGMNHMGKFGGPWWREWNDRFRDDVRRFVRGDGGTIRALSARVLGSPDVFDRELSRAEQSVNFVTAHDGFTLADLYTYEKKNNLANFENNRDGSDYNLSWNCGHEGPTDDPEILSLRRRISKNALTLLMLSVGVPMLLMGDEAGRSQNGNNNTYCQDKEFNYFDWSLPERNCGLHQFVKNLIALRKNGLEIAGGVPWTDFLKGARVQWHSTVIGVADWADHAKCLSATIAPAGHELSLHVILNGSEFDLDFGLPHPCHTPPCQWQRVFDTALPDGEEFAAGSVFENRYPAKSRSISIFFNSHAGVARAG